jgi:hypothetical protein
MVEEYKCFFETADGRVLVSEEVFDDPEAASLWGSRILDNPEMFELLDADNDYVSAQEIDPEMEYTVELIS